MTMDSWGCQADAPLMHPGTQTSVPRLHSSLTVRALADRSPTLSGRPARSILGLLHNDHACLRAVRVSARIGERAAVIAVSASMFGIPSSSSITCP